MKLDLPPIPQLSIEIFPRVIRGIPGVETTLAAFNRALAEWAQAVVNILATALESTARESYQIGFSSGALAAGTVAFVIAFALGTLFGFRLSEAITNAANRSRRRALRGVVRSRNSR